MSPSNSANKENEAPQQPQPRHLASLPVPLFFGLPPSVINPLSPSSSPDPPTPPLPASSPGPLASSPLPASSPSSSRSPSPPPSYEVGAQPPVYPSSQYNAISGSFAGASGRHTESVGSRVLAHLRLQDLPDMSYSQWMMLYTDAYNGALEANATADVAAWNARHLLTALEATPHRQSTSRQPPPTIGQPPLLMSQPPPFTIRMPRLPPPAAHACLPTGVEHILMASHILAAPHITEIHPIAIPVLSTLSRRPLLKTCTIVTWRVDRPGLIEIADLSMAFNGREQDKERMLNMVNLTNLPRRVVNLATVVPDVLECDSLHLIHGRERDIATMTLHGIVTQNDLEHPSGRRQLCMAPFDVGLSRALSILRCAGRSTHYLVRTHEHGLCFSKSLWDTSRPFNDPDILATGALPRNQTTPVYDGRRKFRWSQYTTLPSLPESAVEVGMACVVLFTIGFTIAPPLIGLATDIVEKAISFNIKAVVVVADRNPHAPADTVGYHDIPPSSQVWEDEETGLDRAIDHKWYD